MKENDCLITTFRCPQFVAYKSVNKFDYIWIIVPHQFHSPKSGGSLSHFRISTNSATIKMVNKRCEDMKILGI